MRETIEPGRLDRIIRARPDGSREALHSYWGLLPAGAAALGGAGRLVNARAETLLERASFKGLVARHRCVVPISGYYEWRKDGRAKTPLYIHRSGGGALWLAGLWPEWAEPESGEVLTSHTIITTEANAALAAVHERMPVVLQDEALDEWLDPGIDRPADVLPLLAPAPDELLAAYAVAPLVNNVRNDGPELIAPVAG